jgi:hypothetical protein
MRTKQQHNCYFWFILLIAAVITTSAFAGERELESEPPPASASEIKTPMQKVLPETQQRPSLFPGIRPHLEKLSPFFADTQLEARFRTYYLYKDQTTDEINEACAMGGSIAYRSGWLRDLFQLEVEGFTSQPIYTPDDREGTGLLNSEQDGYSVVGITNGKLRYKGIVLTGFRQYIDLPYVNRDDSRMTPNTFESVTLTKPEGALRFSTGYTWKVKFRTSDRFLSMTKAIGLDKDRGLAHAGAVWEPDENFHIGAIGAVIPDLYAGIYNETGFGCDLTDKWEARFDGQFTYQWETGDDLLGEDFDNAWNLGLRTSASYAGAVFQLGLSITDPDDSVQNFYGSSPSYVDLMQITFTRADEKAILASVSYDFAGLGIDGFSVIANFVAAFDGKENGERDDAQELDVTMDYRLNKGILKSFWLRVRGSWLNEELSDKDGTDIRVILRHDFPMI